MHRRRSPHSSVRGSLQPESFGKYQKSLTPHGPGPTRLARPSERLFQRHRKLLAPTVAFTDGVDAVAVAEQPIEAARRAEADPDTGAGLVTPPTLVGRHQFHPGEIGEQVDRKLV